MLVTPEAILTLRKTEKFDPAPPQLGRRTAGDHWKVRVKQLTEDPQLQTGHATQSAVRRAAVQQVNQELSQLFNVELQREVFE